MKDTSHLWSEYENLGHMTLITSDDKHSYSLPHHGVLKESSTSTKLRVVFDGSMNTSSGLSCNSIQRVGPTIQQELFSILLRFTKHAYVISSDVKKMYRQILIHPEQKKLQKIIWRSNPEHPLQTYTLNTLTYGTTSAPFLAIICLNQLGIEVENTHPQISRIIKEDFYVNDVLMGADTLHQAQLNCENLRAVLVSGGFNLRKWIANDIKILENISSEDIHPNMVQFNDGEQSKTLGLAWNHSKDVLTYSVPAQKVGQIVTKRTILSEIAQIFDHLGTIAPSIMLAKFILQQLLIENLSWDEIFGNSN